MAVWHRSWWQTMVRGVALHESDLIFDRYYRSSESSTQPGSVGIGLAVSRQLAEMMNGSLLYVRGENQHRFELSLPLSVPVTPDESSQELAAAADAPAD